MNRLLEFVFGVDDSKLNNALDDAETKSKKTANDIKSSFKNAVAGIATAFAGLQIGKFLNSAVKSANEFEKAMLGVGASARLAGQDATQAQKNVQKLAEDGQVSLKDSASIMKRLTSLGISASKAINFASAGKKVASFNGVMDTTSESLESFVKGLQTGSAELLENLDPSLQSTIKKLGGYAKVATDATVRQKLINIVIAKGSKLQGEYNSFLETGSAKADKFKVEQEKLLISLGQGFQDAFSGVTSILISVISGFRKFLDTLTPTSKKFLLIGATLTALVPIIFTVINAIKSFTSVSIVLKSVLLSLNPVMLAITAGVAIVTGLAVAISQLNKSTKEEVDEFLKLSGAVNDVESKYNKLLKTGIKTLNQKKQLAEINKQLTKIENEYGLSLTNTNGKLKTTAERIADINKARASQLVVRSLDIQEEQSSLLQDVHRISGSGNQVRSGSQILAMIKANPIGVFADALGRYNELEAQRLRLFSAFEQSQQKNKKGTTATSNTSRSTRTRLSDTGFLDSDFQKKLDAQKKAYKKYLKFVQKEINSNLQKDENGKLFSPEANELRKKANEKLIELRKQLLEEQDKIVNNSLQSEFEKKKNALAKEFDLKIKSLENIRLAQKTLANENIKDEKFKVNEILDIDKKYLKDKEKITLEYLKRETRIKIEQATSNLNKVSSLASAGKDLVNSKSVGDSLSSIGQGVSLFDPVTGGAVSAIGSVATIVQDIFTDNEAIQKQEEEKKNLIETQNKLLEQQRTNIERIRQLEIDRGNLIDKETNLQLKINDIKFANDPIAKAKADKDALTKLLLDKAKSVGIDGNNVEQVGNTISNLNSTNLNDKTAIDMINSMSRLSGSESFNTAKIILNSQLKTIDTALSLGVSSSVSQILNSQRARITDTLTQSTQLKQKSANRAGVNIKNGEFSGSIYDVSNAEIINSSLQKNFAKSASQRNLLNFTSSQLDQTQRLSSDKLSDAEKLLDTIKQIQSIDNSSSNNQSTQLNLRQQRETSLVDVARTGITGVNSVFQSLKSPVQNVGLQTGVNAVTIASQQRKSFQELQTDSLQKINETLIDMLNQLIEINTSSVNISSEQVISDILAKIQGVAI